MSRALLPPLPGRGEEESNPLTESLRLSSREGKAFLRLKLPEWKKRWEKGSLDLATDSLAKV